MHPLSALEFSSRIAKRAQYEAFEFTVTPAGVTVRNASYADPSEHEYTVSVEDGIPVSCTCPADEHYEGACKHRVAVAIRRPVLDAAVEAASTRPTVVADGGQIETDDSQPSLTSSEGDDDECEACLDSFPCWECYRTGKRDLPQLRD